MTKERLTKAAELYNNMFLLKKRAAELNNVKEQIKGNIHIGLNLHFVNTDSSQNSFSVNSELMKSIVKMILAYWENEIILQEKEFEEL